MDIGYLEIVTPDVDATIASYEAALGVRFGAPEPALGNARTAPLASGGRVGVRAPMHPQEVPVVRPYWRVADVDQAAAAAVAQGAYEAHAPLDIPSVARFAITMVGPHQQGWWTDLKPES